MIGILLLSHSPLADELLEAARVIAGELQGFEALCLGWEDDQEKVRSKIAAALERLDRGQGVLILTDMLGGTPCNVARSFLEAERVEILTGVNLPMVLRMACRVGDDQSLTAVARWLQGKGQGSICLLSQSAESSPEDSIAAAPAPSKER